MFSESSPPSSSAGIAPSFTGSANTDFTHTQGRHHQTRQPIIDYRPDRTSGSAELPDATSASEGLPPKQRSMILTAKSDSNDGRHTPTSPHPHRVQQLMDAAKPSDSFRSERTGTSVEPVLEPEELHPASGQPTRLHRTVLRTVHTQDVNRFNLGCANRLVGYGETAIFTDPSLRCAIIS